MKVKKFRIRPRLGIVARTLRSMMSVKQLAADLEESIPKESEDFLSHVAPVAFYQTWSKDEIPPHYRDVLEQAGWEKAIAVSALIATIGPAPEDYLSELLMSGETTRSLLITALSEESADLSLQFLFKLLAEDAKADDCDVSEPLIVVDPNLLAETLVLTGAEQEGIHLDAAAHLTPRFTHVALAGWLPISKKKRLVQVPKKKTS
ncbi:MAG: hypothetical protein LHV69_04250 [Elusimicrobia bacterium]|nr:hypothetical protein [Candidatus Obscuribacterium magneticum]